MATTGSPLDLPLIPAGGARIPSETFNEAMNILNAGGRVNEILTNEVAITGAVTLDSTAFGKMHLISGTSADYTITLFTPATDDLGKIVGFRVSNAGTKIYTLDANSTQTIDGQLTIPLLKDDVIYLKAVATSGNTWQVIGKKEGVRAWIAPSLINSWANFGSGNANVGYMKRDGIVHLKGLVASGTIGAAIFTLPVGYRPAESRNYGTVSNGLFGYCGVLANGNVTANAGSNTWFSIDGISFPAEG